MAEALRGAVDKRIELNEDEMIRVHRYILCNPAGWEDDLENPGNWKGWA